MPNFTNPHSPIFSSVGKGSFYMTASKILQLCVITLPLQRCSNKQSDPFTVGRRRRRRGEEIGETKIMSISHVQCAGEGSHCGKEIREISVFPAPKLPSELSACKVRCFGIFSMGSIPCFGSRYIGRLAWS